MTENYRMLVKCSDAAILDFYKSLEEELGAGALAVRIYGSAEGVENNDEMMAALRSSQGQTIESAAARLRPTEKRAGTINFVRGGYKLDPGNNCSVQPSLYFDHLKIVDVEQIPASTAHTLNRLVQDKLASHPPISIADAITSSSGPGFSDLIKTHHQIITTLTQQISAVGSEYAAARHAMEDEFAQRKAKLQEDADAIEQRLKAEHQQKLDDIEQERSKLAERVRELDDRDNTHARRDLHKNFKKQIDSYKQQFQLTAGTRRLRVPVTVTVAAIESAVLWLAFIVYMSWSPGSDLADKILFGVKTFGLTFVAVGTAVWYLKWLTQWSNRHAEAEFQLKQLELDMDRASWVVETAFEWKSSQADAIPLPLLEAISRNLFAVGDARNEQLESPADHLASAILGNAATVKLKAGDTEIGIDRKGLRELQKPG